MRVARPLLVLLVIALVGSAFAPVAHAQAPRKKTRATSKPAPIAETGRVTPSADSAAKRIPIDTVPVAAATPVKDSAPLPKKHGGLFGKVKGLAASKAVRQVAKVAACTMIPGGQMIAGAMDAGSGKNASGAVGGAAGAATGSPCAPAMAGPGAAAYGAGGGTAAQAAMIQQAMAAQQAMAMQRSMSGMAGPGSMPTGVVPAIAVSPSLSVELAKGKTTIRSVPWVPGEIEILPQAAADYHDLVVRLAEALKQAPGTFKLTVWAADAGSKDVNKQVAERRGAALQSALIEAGVEAGRFGRPPEGKQGDPRIEIAKN